MLMDPSTLGFWTIARFAAVAVLVTETLFMWTRHRAAAVHGGPSRIAWALTPAVILATVFAWCSLIVVEQQQQPSGSPAATQIARR